MLLHEWHVLISGSMIKKIRGIVLDDLLDALSIQNVANHRNDLERRMFALELDVYKIEVAFRPLEQDEQLWSKGGQLPAKLRADRAPRPGHEDSLPLELLSEPVEIQPDRLPPEEILRPHFLEPPNPRLALKQLVKGRNGLEGHPALPAPLKDPPPLLPRGRRDGDKDFLNLPRPAQLRQGVNRSHHLNAVDSPPLLPGIIIHEAHNFIIQRETPVDLPDQHLPPISGSDDEGPLRLALPIPPARLPESPEGEPHPAIHCGATPILVDVRDDYNMDPDQVERAITARTKAILPVHLNGRVCDMDRIMAIAERYGLLVIEDTAQALGAAYKGQRAGSFGVAGCFSFYPFKVLGGFGDGGAVTTNDPEIARMVSLLRYNGEDRDTGEYHYHGYTALLDNVQAAVLDVKLRYLPKWIEHRRKVAALYRQGLEGVGDLKLPHFSEEHH